MTAGKSVQERLDALGRMQPAEIAAKMPKGFQACPFECPLALFFEADGSTVYQWNHREIEVDGRTYSLPMSVREFVRLFDCGAYPALVASIDELLQRILATPTNGGGAE